MKCALRRYLLFFPGLCLALFSCSPYKYVPKDDKLYTGASLNVLDGKLAKDHKEFLKALGVPKPNARFLGIRYRLILFNMFKEPRKNKGLVYTIKRKWGEPPALLSQARPTLTENKMKDYLFSIGFLQPEVHQQIYSKKKTASITYEITHNTRYTIGKIIYPYDTTAIIMLLDSTARRSLVKKGEFVDLNTFSAERQRIDLFLKNRGYYYFVPEYLLFKLDTVHHGVADVYLKFKPDVPQIALNPWRLGDISVYGNYNQNRDSMYSKMEGKKGIKYTVFDNRETFKTDLYDRAILLKPGQRYNRNTHSLSIERLMNLGSFRFVRMNFIPDPDSAKRLLNTKIYLTPARRNSVRLELSGNSKSNNFLGSEIAVNYRNVNMFHGAEIFNFKISAGFDKQVGGQQQNSDAYTLSADANLAIPKVIFPVKVNLKTGRNPYLPRTIIGLGAEYLERRGLYTLRSLKFDGGYQWKVGRNMEHYLKLININAITPTDITPAFDSILQNDFALRASFERQLIIGSRYTFKFNNTYRAAKSFNLAFDLDVSNSGNLVSLFMHPSSDTVGAKQILGVPISQYVRLEGNIRGYWRINSGTTLASRFIAGAGWAYGNSITLPYAEQFFIGGSSSLRAFRARTIGPGSFYETKQEFQANQSGEVKFELNSELRYSLTKLFKVAAFVDAGNIWLRKDAIDKPGSGLDWGDLLTESAMGAGVGLRIDASVLVIRFDLAMPLRKPWLNPGDRWVIDQIRFGDGQWRKENLILNIGIGYPF